MKSVGKRPGVTVFAILSYVQHRVVSSTMLFNSSCLQNDSSFLKKRAQVFSLPDQSSAPLGQVVCNTICNSSHKVQLAITPLCLKVWLSLVTTLNFISSTLPQLPCSCTPSPQQVGVESRKRVFPLLRRMDLVL
jgi:hypothetical protein